MDIRKCILTNNDCYKTAQKITPKGIVVHSTGANNPQLKRYVQPDDGLLGLNQNNNHWNTSGLEKCVHAFIGEDKNGIVRIYQTLPFDYACWGVGSSKSKTKDPNRVSYGKDKNGNYLYSYNYNPAYIQFEICEDNLKDKDYFDKAFNLAIEFCKYLCKEFNIPTDNIVSHSEAHQKGYGSNHSDCDHWLKKFGKDMNWFRERVKGEALTTQAELYRVRKSWKDAASQIGAYKSLDNAKKVCKQGYFVFDSKGNVVYTPETKNTIKVGSTVKIKSGAKTYTGSKLATFVYNRKHKVKEIKGDRVVVAYLGIVVAAVNINDLTIV